VAPNLRTEWRNPNPSRSSHQPISVADFVLVPVLKAPSRRLGSGTMEANVTDHRDYRIKVLETQVKHLEIALNEVRAKLGLAELQLPKPAR
jgi:hypothetical protein